MNGHFVEVCECGKVYRQCRCPGPKTTLTVSPCVHVHETGELDEGSQRPELEVGVEGG